MWKAHELPSRGSSRRTTSWPSCAGRWRRGWPSRRRPRARWRTRVVADGNLRWYRTMMFGRSPGFAPGPAAVGPWRPVRLTRHSAPWLEQLALRPRLEGADGMLSVSGRLRAPDGVSLPGTIRATLAGRTTELQAAARRWLRGPAAPRRRGALVAAHARRPDPVRDPPRGRRGDSGQSPDRVSQPALERRSRNATGSLCSSTACPCSPAAPSGHPRTWSRWPRAPRPSAGCSSASVTRA